MKRSTHGKRGTREASAEERVDSLNALGRELSRSDPRRAREIAEEAQRLAADTGYAKGVVRSLSTRGTVEVLGAHNAEATGLFEQALLLAREQGDDEGIAAALLGVARVLRAEGRVDEAVRSAKEAINHARAANDTLGEADGTNYLGTLYGRRGDLRRARTCFRTALRLAEEIGDKHLQTSCLLHIALADHGRSADYKTTIASLESLLELAHNEGWRYLECTILDNLGRFHGELGNYPEALARYMRSIEIAGEIGARMLHVNALSGISLVHKKFGDFGKATAYATESLALARAIGFRDREATMLNNIGNIAYIQRDYERALEHYNACRTLCEEIGDRSLLATLLSNIANVHRDSARYDEATAHYTLSLEVAGAAATDHDLATWHMNLGRLHLDKREFGPALEHFTKALAHAETIGLRPLVCEVHADLTSTYEGRGDEGDMARALAHHRAYLALREEVLGNEKQREIAELRARAEIERTEKEREIYRLQKEKLELDMRHKTEELTAMALRLVEKNELIGSLKEEIGRLSQSGGAGDLVESLLRRIDTSTATERDWATFEERLHQVHHGFMTELARRSPQLRPAELKVCALLRMQLSTKEIASLLAVSERAVEKHRYQIRGKLGLAKEANLAAVLAGM